MQGKQRDSSSGHPESDIGTSCSPCKNHEPLIGELNATETLQTSEILALLLSFMGRYVLEGN